jgi:hypothetical protein
MRKPFLIRTVDELTVEDERSFRHVGLYSDLKEVLRRAKYPFRVLHDESEGRWDQALVLNLTFWGANQGGDVLVDSQLDADVLAHAAWHHLAAAALTEPGAGLSADAMFLGEAIASAFDVYLVGRLLGHAEDSTFLQSQVPAMEDAADLAGCSPEAFAELLQTVSENPERSFEDMRQLLWDATTGLAACTDAESAVGVLLALEDHRLAPLLYRFELSSWVLYARAYATSMAPSPVVRAAEQAMRDAKVSLEWLETEWIAPALGRQVNGG